MTTKYQRYLARKREKNEQNPKKTEKTGHSWSRTTERDLAVVSPIHECLITDTLSEKGMGHLYFTRLMPDGRISAGIFLVDIFCLGVKDAFFSIIEKLEYETRIKNRPGQDQLVPISPACLRKLVEGAVAYARDLGFEPHGDYAEARQIFGDQETASCTQGFTYGREGKPLYISGPFESQARAKAIVAQLRQRKGEDGYHFIVGADDLDDVVDLES
jgi:hypothetical protein